MSSRVKSPDPIDGLFQLSFLLQDRLAEIAARHELSAVQVRMLGILRDREPGMLELARHLKLEKSSLSGLIDRAGMRGLVERIPSNHDRRAATVRMTPLGREMARRVTEEVQEEVQAFLAVLPARDQRKLAELVQALLGQTASPLDG